MTTARSMRSVTLLALVLAAAAASADVVIPSSVYRRGAGGAEFRSDVRIFNPDERARERDADPLRPGLGPDDHEARRDDSAARRRRRTTTSWGRSSGRRSTTAPSGRSASRRPAPLIVSSSVNNYNACGNASVSGQWLPGLDAASALRTGTLVQLAVERGHVHGLPHERRLHESRHVRRDRRREGPPRRRTLVSEGTIGPLPRERLHADRELGPSASPESTGPPTRTSGWSSRATSPSSRSRPSSTTPRATPSRSS